MTEQQQVPVSREQYLDYHYREFVRLCDRQCKMVDNSFDDIKMAGVIGAMLAWKPLVNAYASGDQPYILLIGFVTILFVTLILFLQNFMRQSIMLFFMEEIKHHEDVLRNVLLDNGEQSFSVAKHWRGWSKRIHEPIAIRFFIYVYLLLSLFPAGIFAANQHYNFSLAYLVIAAVFLAIHATVTITIIRHVDQSTG